MKLLDYILGSRKGEKANRMERKAMRDPFLYEVLDGYDRVPHDTETALRELRKEIRMRTSNRRKNLFIWSSVASLLILVLGGLYFVFVTHLKEEENFLTLGEEVFPIPEKTDFSETDSTVLSMPEVTEKKEQKSEMVIKHVPAKSEVIQKEEQTLGLVSKPLDVKVRKTVVSPSVFQTTTGIISGIITDDSGEPLIGVQVVKKNVANRGTTTNIEGYFELEATQGEELVFSYIGFEPQTIVVEDDFLQITLYSDNVLDEVVITGAGIQREVTVTGAITSVNVNELKTPAKDISGVLAGNVRMKENKPEKSPRISTKKSMPDVGYKTFKKYIEENRRYTGKGKVVLVFSVNIGGRPVDIEVKKSTDPKATADAIRLIKEGPNWSISGKQVKYTVRF